MANRLLSPETVARMVVGFLRDKCGVNSVWTNWIRDYETDMQILQVQVSGRIANIPVSMCQCELPPDEFFRDVLYAPLQNLVFQIWGANL